ncbi:transporter [Spirochaetia bacterium]|nr:transporter [Spirochaetia bacterium]
MIKKRITKIIWLCIVLLCASFVSAQEKSTAKKISMEEAVKLAIENNLSLQSQAITTNTKKRAADHAWNKFVPSLSLTGSYTADNKAATTSGFAVTDLGLMPYTVDLSKNHIAGQVQVQLPINFAMFEAINSLKNDYQNGVITYDKAKAQLEQTVRKLYYDILFYEVQLNFLKESYNNAKAQEDSAAASFRAGRSPELSWLQAQVTTKNMEPSINQLNNSIKLVKGQLAMNLGLPITSDIQLEPSENNDIFIPLDVSNLIQKASQNKPDILEVKQQLLTLKSQRKATLYQRWTPNLSLSWNSQSVFKLDPFKDDLGTEDNWNNTGGFTIALSWTPTSLLPFGVDTQGIKDIDDNIQKLNIGLAQSVQATELEIYSKVYELEQIRASIEAQRATIQLAQRSYNDTFTAYRNGSQNYQQVQDANIQLQNSRLNLTQQYNQYIKGLIDLEYSIGVPFGTLSSK